MLSTAKKDCGVLQHFWARTQRYREAGYDRFAAADLVASRLETTAGAALDVGTGHGLLATALAKLGIGVTTGDVSTDNYLVAAALVTAAGVAERVRFLLCDAMRLPFPDRHFDCVAMMNVLHHIEHAEPTLAELARVTRPAGRILLADFSEAGFELVSRVHREGGGEHPRSAVTLDAACAALTRLGWRLLSREVQHFQEIACLARATTRRGGARGWRE